MVSGSQWGKATLSLYHFITYVLDHWISVPTHSTHLWEDPFIYLAIMHVKSLLCFCGWDYNSNVLRRKLTQPHSGLTDFHVTESQTVLNVSKGEAKPPRADPHMNRVPEGKAKSLPAHGKDQVGVGVWGEGLLLVPFFNFFIFFSCL